MQTSLPSSRIRRSVLVVLVAVTAAGCAMQSQHDRLRPLLEEDQKTGIADEHPKTYIKVTTPGQRLEQRRISINASDISLMDAVMKALPGVSVIPVDADVDLRKPVSLYANQVATADLLRQLTGATGYAFDLKDGRLLVSSVAVKHWNIAPLVTRKRSQAVVGQTFTAQGDTQSVAAASGVASATTPSRTADTSGRTGSTHVTVTNEQDVWTDLLKSAQRILGIGGNDALSPRDTQALFGSTGGIDPDAARATFAQRAKLPFVAGVRNLGLIAAAGPPSRMQVLDDYLNGLVASGSRQVNLDVKAYEVTLSDERSRGIDWNVFWENLNTGATTTVTGGAPASLLSGGGTWTIAAQGPYKNVTAEALIRFLGRHGQVSILTQPNVTITNGSTAYLSSGDEFSFIADIEQAQDAQGQVSVSPRFSRMRVGVTLAVTPRVLDDERIAIEIVPVLSSLQGFDEFTVQNFEFGTPKIALQELSTQVITRSGKTVHLGGLITRHIAETLSRLPLLDPVGKWANYVLGSQANTLSRRELVITLTPRLVRS